MQVNGEPCQGARTNYGILPRSYPKHETVQGECDASRRSSFRQDGAITPGSRDGSSDLDVVEYPCSFATTTASHQFTEQGPSSKGTCRGT